VRPVNLLPARYQRARATGERAGIGYTAVGALAVLLLMAVLYVVTNNGIKDAHEKTAKANAEQQTAQARAGDLQAYGDFASLKASREAAVMGVAETRFDYERLMREVALVLPHNTYLTNFAATTTGGTTPTAGATTTSTTPAATAGTATGSGPSLTLSGCAPSHDGVATTIVRLRQLHDVSDVSLSNSTKGGSSGSTASSGPSGGAGCKVSWAATLTFQSEAPQTTQQPVPARLGGGQ
jgi:Tfp pilus assembly protein PilN